MQPEMIYMGVLQYLVLLFSLVFHEFGHAWTALRCGDPTAKYLGRVTLNPIAHADPVGTVLFPLVQIFTHVPLIGWARPVPFNPANLRNPRRDDVLISAAGPGFNLILALCAAVLSRVSLLALGTQEVGFGRTTLDFLRLVLPMFMYINVMLAFFNLIPFPPLDGSWIAYRLLPRGLAERYRTFGTQWGMLAVLLLMLTGIAGTFVRAGWHTFGPVLLAIAGL
jgi:Zn-dependent protease